MRSVILGSGGGIPAPGRRPAGVELKNDLTAAQWITDKLWPWLRGHRMRVGSLVPVGFEAYARLFHPASLQTADGNWQAVRWSEVAAWHGRTVHPLMQFHRIANLPDETLLQIEPEWGDAPEVGSLPLAETAILAGLLREFTGAPESCYFGVWEGWGFLDYDFYERQPRIQAFRDCLLFRGPLSALPFPNMHGHSPTLWWPADRAWCVATEIDFIETIIGGSAAGIRRILDHPELEALPVAIDGLLEFDGDALNPPTPMPG